MNLSPGSIVGSLFVSSASSFLLIYLLMPLLRRRMLDHPSIRGSHLVPTPRGGGVVFVLVASLACAFAWMITILSASPLLTVVFVPLAALPLALVGFLDDRFNLPVSWRYGVQLSTALVMIFVSPLIVSLFRFLPLVILLLIAVTAVINFTNFMDGLDGLVAGCMAVAITALSIWLSAPWPLWSLVGALFGFLLWNWSPAKVFMGDVGSTFLGAVFAGLVLQASSWGDALCLLLIITPILADASFCVPRRLFAGQSVFHAHRLHLFQRLHQAGWSHSRVSLVYIAATAVLAVALLVGGWQWVVFLACVELLVGLWLDCRVAVPFIVAIQSS